MDCNPFSSVVTDLNESCIPKLHRSLDATLKPRERSHLHQASVSKQRQHWDDAGDIGLTENNRNNRVAKEWVQPILERLH